MTIPRASEVAAVRRLAASVAHEINTPMQYVGDNLAFATRSLEALLVLYARTASLLTPEQLERARFFEEEADLAYLRSEIPKALGQGSIGVEHVADAIRAMEALARPEYAGGRILEDGDGDCR